MKYSKLKFQDPQVLEEAPPDMEDWIEDNKESFKKRYGKKWEPILYATAWKMHNKKNESFQGDFRAKTVSQLMEEQVHPADKIGQSMLKKMKTPNYFKQNKKGEVHQTLESGENKKMKGEDPCWPGYEMVGSKKKKGKEVPNCVPKKKK